MYYYEDVSYRVKRIVKSHHEFAMGRISYQINLVSFLDKLIRL